MGEMSEHKSHHYVPKLYMRLFSGGLGERVGVFIIAQDRFIPKAPIKGQACRDFFYGTDGGAEAAFGALENQTAPTLRALLEGQLPSPASEAYERLMLYIGIQHSRTVDAEAQFAEAAEKTVVAMLRTKLELEGNADMLEKLDLVTIKRTHAVGDAIRAATVGASLLTDLALLVIRNQSGLPFVSSDTPVVLHNRLYEATELVSAAGYASVGLQVFLPLGPEHLLLAFDSAAYSVVSNEPGVVGVHDADVVRALNDLQWEAADKVILATPLMPAAELHAQAARWRPRRTADRAIYRQEVVSTSENEVRIMQGVGPRPSSIKLELPFLRMLLPIAPPLGPYDRAPVRDLSKVAKVERVSERLFALEELLREQSGRQPG